MLRKEWILSKLKAGPFYVILRILFLLKLRNSGQPGILGYKGRLQRDKHISWTVFINEQSNSLKRFWIWIPHPGKEN